MDPEEELYQLACQDMPVTGSEVREVMGKYREHLLGLQHTLLRDLIEQHRPVIRRTPMTVDPLMRDAQCPACDGNRWKAVLEGTDEVPECEFWKRAKRAGLVEGGPRHV